LAAWLQRPKAIGNAVTTNLVAFAAHLAPQRIRLDQEYRKRTFAAG